MRERRIRRTGSLALWIAVSAALALGVPSRALELVVSAGEHGIVEGREHMPVEAGITARMTGTEIWRSKRGMVLVPALGAMTTQEEVIYGWFGGALMIPLSPRWGLVPEAGAGLYERGKGKNLGGTLEFRSGVEATYRANDSVRLGVGFYHLSNAGLHALNPGVNSILVTFGVRPKSHARVWDTSTLR